MKNFVLYSQLAFYPMHWAAFRYICEHYQVRGAAIARVPPALPGVHQQLGWIDPGEEARQGFKVDVQYVPDSEFGEEASWIVRTLRDLRPDAIWVQEEPTDRYLLRILRAYWLDRHPRIVTAVCENIFPAAVRTLRSQGGRLYRRLLWSRLNGLLAVATASIDGIRAAGMPVKVPARTLVAGGMAPPGDVQPLALPFQCSADDFLVGFAGRITEEKGWKVLLKAMAGLPPRFHCLLAGDGPQADQLRQWSERADLKGRVHWFGLLPKDRLWEFYAALDCLVLPSLTTLQWKEQFGGVLADGMAMGLPLVGSDSGAIPEVIGPAGLVFPEGDGVALADCLVRFDADRTLCARLGEAGKQRFAQEFSIPAYARKIADSLDLELLDANA